MFDMLVDIPQAESESTITSITSDLKAYEYLARCFGDLSHPATLSWRGPGDTDQVDVEDNPQAKFGQSACSLLLC